MLTTCI